LRPVALCQKDECINCLIQGRGSPSIQPRPDRRVRCEKKHYIKNGNKRNAGFGERASTLCQSIFSEPIDEWRIDSSKASHGPQLSHIPSRVILFLFIKKLSDSRFPECRIQMLSWRYLNRGTMAS
jgi:hypothetical protein